VNPNIYDWLRADSVCVGLLSITGPMELAVFQDEAPEGTKDNYVVWGLITGEATNYTGNAPSSDFNRYQLNIWAKTQNERDAILKAVRDVLEFYGFVTSYNPYVLRQLRYDVSRTKGLKDSRPVRVATLRPEHNLRGG
jgi:hypothetical protein